MNLSRSCVAPAYTATSSATAVALRRVRPLIQPTFTRRPARARGRVDLHGETVGPLPHPAAADYTSGVHTSVVPVTMTPAAVPVCEKAAMMDSVTGATTATVAAAPFRTAVEPRA